MLWKARLRLRRKIALTVLFSGGIFVMAAGILRCVWILTVSPLSTWPGTSRGNALMTYVAGRQQRRPAGRQLGVPRVVRGGRDQQHPHDLPAGAASAAADGAVSLLGVGRVVAGGRAVGGRGAGLAAAQPPVPAPAVAADGDEGGERRAGHAAAVVGGDHGDAGDDGAERGRGGERAGAGIPGVDAGGGRWPAGRERGGSGVPFAVIDDEAVGQKRSF